MTDTTKDDLDVTKAELLVLELVKRQAAIKADQDRIAEIRQILLKLGPGTHRLAGEQVIVSKPRTTLNVKAIAEAYPVVQHPELYSPAVDNEKVRHHFAPADLEQYTRAGSSTVTIR